ncbi:glycosyltransferase family 2 protein [Afifella sp. YEN Y35]|uniref:glycosyltransferase family 2 protein n=1 Tax=Afifella sp. YEN Y35 TaxID=3388337 RepID=UPI0039DFCE9F
MRAVDLRQDCAACEYVNVSGADGAYTATSDDPQIRFRPVRPLEPGWYHCAFEISGNSVVTPQIVIDTGKGFLATYRVSLKSDRRRNRFSADFYLPEPANELCLYPADGAGKFEIGRLRIKRRNRAETLLFFAGHAIQILWRDPMRLVRRFRQYWHYLRRPHFVGVRTPSRLSPGGGSYPDWIKRYDYQPDRDRKMLETQIKALERRPVISVLMPVYNPPADLLDAAIRSVVEQVYPDWELCIADDASSDPEISRRLEAWAEHDPRIKVVRREINGHISAATNSAFAVATGDWIALLDHDDVLRENALGEVAVEIGRHPDAEIVYSDEDKLGSDGLRYEPYFKPDYSRELLRSQNYFNHLTVHRAENIRRVGGWRVGFEGSQDYDLNLRIAEIVEPGKIRHIPKVLYHWRAVEGSTAMAGGEKNYAYLAGQRALEDHVTRTGLPAKVEPAPGVPFYRLKLSVPEPRPLVSLIIPTRDHAKLLRGCIESILTKTTYDAYEILIVDNGSVEPETHRYFEELRADPKVRVISYNKPFNYAAINNFAAVQANGAILGLVNNDIEVISPDWLKEMVSWAVQPDIGCVGAKLYYADDTIQHAGVILGIGGVAGHSHKYFPREEPGYFGRLKILQNVSAVTAACLIVRKEVYEAVGGLDEEHLAVAFNDVDFCLAVQKLGFANVFTPYAEMYHLESISRGHEDNSEKQARFFEESLYMQKKWQRLLARDPFYSPNLSREHEDFSLRS